MVHEPFSPFIQRVAAYAPLFADSLDRHGTPDIAVEDGQDEGQGVFREGDDGPAKYGMVVVAIFRARAILRLAAFLAQYDADVERVFMPLPIVGIYKFATVRCDNLICPNGLVASLAVAGIGVELVDYFLSIIFPVDLREKIDRIFREFKLNDPLHSSFLSPHGKGRA